MLAFRPLPWEYGIRNLLRRPGRSLLTLSGLTLVVLLVFVVVGFIRGLEASLAVSGDPQVVLVHAMGASENVENSSIAARTPSLLAASLPGIQRRTGSGGTPIAYASPELFLGTQVNLSEDEGGTLGLVRGVTPAAALVRRSVQILEGDWPKAGEVLVGRLAATKLGRNAEDLAVGRTLTIENRTWRISGRFASMGSALEAELWCPLEDLQHAMKRQDISVVAFLLSPGSSPSDVDEFCRERLDLELQATPETAYYEGLNKHYGPVRALAWLIVFLVAGSGVFAGLNTMYGAVVGRVRELATLQALGYVRRAVALALVQESTLLAAAGSLVASAIALVMINGVAVRFTMGAFTLRVDSVALMMGCGMGLLLGFVGSVPPALKAMRMPIAEGLKTL
ncbi:MAG: ABC transporter permease [Gemmataceae bacterium]|nr:ABC transporter permease [Gemmataceae bacterium]